VSIELVLWLYSRLFIVVSFLCMYLSMYIICISIVLGMDWLSLMSLLVYFVIRFLGCNIVATACQGDCCNCRQVVLNALSSLMPSNYISIVGNPSTVNASNWLHILR